MKKWLGILLSAMLLFVGLAGGIGCSKKQKERTVYEIVAEYKPSDHTLTGTVKVDFYNGYEREIDCLKLQLYPNAYRKGALYSPIGYDVMTEAYYVGASYGEIVISSVLGCLQFEIGGEDKNVLYAYLAKPLAPEERAVLDIGFSTKLAKVNHRLGVAEDTVNLAGAFPTLCAFTDAGFYECVPSDVGDPFFSECANYCVQLTLPKEYHLACVGEVVEEKSLESKKRYTVSALNVRDFAFALSTKFHLAKTHTGKTAVQYYHFGKEDPSAMLELARQAIEYYSSVFGEYPYDCFSLIETEIVRGSADHAGLCMLSGNLTGEASILTVLKEIAAQWWYSLVGANRMENAWLVDGLSAYSALLFLDAHPQYAMEKGKWIDEARQRYQEYKTTYQKALGWVDTGMNRPLSAFLNDYEYQSISTEKAVVMFAELEKGIGGKRLLSSLRKYVAENEYGLATPAHLVGAFERTGLDVGGFFEGYVSGKGTF